MLSKTINLIIIITVLIIFNRCCDNHELDSEIPSCIDDKIEIFKTIAVQKPPAKIWKWEVDGQTYYYIPSECCDQFNFLYDDNCIKVCAPDGGFSGAGDGNCPDFQGTIERTLVWEDQRN